MASFKLDDIRKAAEAKYGSTDIEVGDKVVRLVNPLRLPKKTRQELTGLQDKLDESGADQEDVLREAIKLVAESAGAAKILLDAIGDDLTILVEIFRNYTESTQVGEASASES